MTITVLKYTNLKLNPLKQWIDEPDPVFADDLRNNYLNIPNYNNFSEKTAQEKTMLLLSQKYGFTVEELQGEWK